MLVGHCCATHFGQSVIQSWQQSAQVVHFDVSDAHTAAGGGGEAVKKLLAPTTKASTK